MKNEPERYFGMVTRLFLVLISPALLVLHLHLPGAVDSPLPGVGDTPLPGVGDTPGVLLLVDTLLVEEGNRLVAASLSFSCVW